METKKVNLKKGTWCQREHVDHLICTRYLSFFCIVPFNFYFLEREYSAAAGLTERTGQEREASPIKEGGALHNTIPVWDNDAKSRIVG